MRLGEPGLGSASVATGRKTVETAKGPGVLESGQLWLRLLDCTVAYTSRGLPSFIPLYFVLFLGQGLIMYPWLV